MRIRIVQAECVGNARCAAIAADLYPLDEDGYIDTTGFEVPPGREQDAQRGARACPERIIIVEEDSGTILWPPQKEQGAAGAS